MRKFAFFTVLFLVCFSVFGQASEKESNEINLYVLPIAGYGRERDNDYFYKQLAYEVFFQHHVVVSSQGGSNYIFKGTIEPISGVPVKQPVNDPANNYSLIPEKANPPVRNSRGRQEYFSIEKAENTYFIDSTGDVSSLSETKAQPKENGYYFILELLDSKTKEPLGKRKILYYDTDASVGRLVSVIVYELLSDIPEAPAAPKRGDSRDRWLYFETSPLWMPKIYYGGYDKISLLGFGVRQVVEVRFLDFMSLGVSVQVTQETLGAESGADKFTDLLMLEFPVFLKYVLRIDEKYVLEPYAGVSMNYPMNKYIEPSKYSWVAGAQFGIRDNNEVGMFVIDPRFSMDFYDSVISGKGTKYQRYCFQLALGYKFGVIQKKK
jgi:hypothetical protein